MMNYEDEFDEDYSLDKQSTDSIVIKCDGKTPFLVDQPVDQKIKQTAGKAPLGNLLEFNLALEEVVRVRQYGKTKYDPITWREVPSEELDHAILRHMFNPAEKDDETGLSHKAHAIQNLLFQLQKELENER